MFHKEKKTRMASIMDNINAGGTQGGPRILVYLLLDVSGSMCGPAIQAVNEGVEFIVCELKGVPEAIEMANVCIITFGSSAQVAIPLTPVPQLKAHALTCGGGTDMAAAIRELNKLLDRDFRPTFEGKARGDYKPTIFLLTDGEPNDLNSTVSESRNLQNRKKGQGIGTFVALGCGPSVNENNLRQIAPNVMLMPNMTPDNIKAFFRWVTASVVNASKTASQAAGGTGAAGGLQNAPPPIPEGSGGQPAFKFTF